MQHIIETMKPGAPDSIGIIFLSDRQLAERYGVSRPTIWAWVKTAPSFPRPKKLSPGCTRWALPEILAWESTRRAA